MTAPLRPARLLAFGAAGLAAACAFQPSTSPPTGVACAAEAEQLLEPVVVRAAPDPGAAPLGELEVGRFVYRCERRGDWLAIRFPRAGEPVDCMHRSRAAACPTGWVRGGVRTAVFG